MELEEPMDVDTSADFEKFDDMLEEGEYIECNHVTRKTLPSVVSVPENKYENKSKGFVTGIDIFSKEARLKMEERAKRFGIVKEAGKFDAKEVENLYESFDIIEDDAEINHRLNVIHMRGMENMSTKDILKYFEEYAPSSVEWINDLSCNILWLDKASAARAMLGTSKKILGIKKEFYQTNHSDNSDENSADDSIVNGKNYKQENSVYIKDIRCPVPPGIWRKGRNYNESKNIFLRFATQQDVRQPHTEKTELKGILTSSRKRLHKQLSESSPTSKKESNSNGIAAKNPWGLLSKTWGVTDVVEDDYLPKVAPEPVSNVKERLGFKSQEKEVEERDPNVIELSDESNSESSSEEENWCKRSKIPRMRMHADDEEEKIQKRKGKIRDLAYHRTKVKDNDLRGRLTAKRRLPPKITTYEDVYQDAIQVIVTNSRAIQSNFKDINVTEDEDEDDNNEIEEVVHQDDDEDEEEEEGEIIDDSEDDSKVEYEEEEEEEEDVEEQESESESDSSDSSIPEKEVQGPKGSVIKVVQHKPKLASTVSTVWSRLNHSKKDTNNFTSDNRKYDCHSKTDLRHTLRKNDLRSRIGNHHMKGRSPLRIELRNDKYEGRQRDSD